jgi:(E)-4-hydroxy-3-methylbut-2-enyl-diphosphate synthase
LVAYIHFDYRLAIEAAEAGISKIRINPGNIGSAERIRAVAKVCIDKNIPIRIGINGGSLEKELLAKYGSPTPEALCESALNAAAEFERADFDNLVLSVKSSNVPSMIKANRLLAQACDYPLHLGVTEAGARDRALVKSSVGVGTLLAEGIGDTLRVSLTDEPVEEISAAREILSALKLSTDEGMDIVSCPTCGRTKINLISLLSEFEDRVKALGLDRKKIKVAIMGCAVNGPGEAREADIGVAGGVGEALLFKKGVTIRKIKEEHIVDELVREIMLMV